MRPVRCPACGKTFDQGQNRLRIYCTSACRQFAYRIRNHLVGYLNTRYDTPGRLGRRRYANRRVTPHSNRG